MKIAIIGAGGHGRVVLDILRNNHQFEVAGFLDSDPLLHGRRVDGAEILGDLGLIDSFDSLGIGAAVIAIGDNRIRLDYAETLRHRGVNLVSAIHPSANIAGNAVIGKNVVIAAGVNICTHVVVEDSAILNTGAIADHESTICFGAHICPGVRLAGHVNISPAAFVGIGATVVQGITIGRDAVVGAGAVVLNDVPAYSTVVGVPAKVVKSTHLPVGSADSAVDRASASTADLEPARSLITRPVRRRPSVEAEPLVTGRS